MAIYVNGPRTRYDDLEHFSLPGSIIDQTTDLYTNDTIVVNSYGRDTTVLIHGGNDTVTGGYSDDTIYDNRGANSRPIPAPNGTVHILPGSGPSGDDKIYAGDGNDTIFAGDGQNIYDGGRHTDTVDYSRASVELDVDLDVGNGQGRGRGDGTDTLVSIENVVGSNQDDWIAGSSVANVLSGGRGADDLWGEGGRDTLFGGADDDWLSGGAGADTMYGEGGIDTLNYLDSASGVTVDLAKGTGRGGDAEGDSFKTVENIRGSWHDDTLIGNNGDNELAGTLGQDTLVGGGGKDRFVFFSSSESTVARPDLIKDFVKGEDKIDLSDFFNQFANGQQSSMTFVDGFSGQAGQVTARVQAGGTTVLGDLNGDRVADFAIELSNPIQLAATDFLF